MVTVVQRVDLLRLLLVVCGQRKSFNFCVVDLTLVCFSLSLNAQDQELLPNSDI